MFDTVGVVDSLLQSFKNAVPRLPSCDCDSNTRPFKRRRTSSLDEKEAASSIEPPLQILVSSTTVSPQPKAQSQNMSCLFEQNQDILLWQ